MNLEVTSVSKQPETLLQAPAAIQVITGEEIRRSGATSLPEALRLADNLEVAQQNAHDWAISARGFNANLANKLLVLIDGRAVYTPLYGGVLWNVQDYLLEDIDRIEVISGPGGTLWGANAVNGVINIIDQERQRCTGALCRGGRGQGDSRSGGRALRHRNWLPMYIFVSTASIRTTAMRSPRMVRTPRTVAMAGADFVWIPILRVGAISPSRAISIVERRITGRSVGPRIAGGNVLGRWTRTLASDSGLSLQTYYDRTYISSRLPLARRQPPYYTGFPCRVPRPIASIPTIWIFSTSFALGDRHRVIWGLGYRSTHEDDEDLSVVQFTPPSTRSKPV